MKKVENKIMLITYANTMGENLQALDRVLKQHFSGVFGGIHVLPFFPSSGDRGFAVIHYDSVDPAFGDWDDIDRLGKQYYLMADFMLNHVSIRCAEFQDYMQRGDDSPYRDMFIDWNKFWPNGEPTEAELDVMYRRKEKGPFFSFTRADGKTVNLWNTFFQEQVDIDPYSNATQDYYRRNLGLLAKHVPLIRFDAFAYASKKPGTSCFFVEPEIWDVLETGMKPLHESGTEMLPEIHENYTIQLKMAEKGYWVYDFALPMLLLHGLMSGRTDRLIHWLNICPRKQFTTLDTHDGIGVVDVAGLLTDEEIDFVRAKVDEITLPAQPYMKFPSMIKTSGKQAQRYQLMCSYYSALGADDRAYLLARAVQFFTPGIPQVYYVGLLAGENDIEALKRGEEPRSINRHTYTGEEIAETVQQPMLQQLYRIMRFRNEHPAFNGTVEIGQDSAEGKLAILWRNGADSARLAADFVTKAFTITTSDETGEHTFSRRRRNMGNLKLPNLFQSGMVLQRRTPVCIWGTAPEGSLVVVSLAGYTAYAVAVDGSFRTYLPPMEAGSGYTLRVSAHGRTITMEDVAIGEVWLAGGQSNMEFLLRDDAEVTEELAVDLPDVRCYEVPKIAYEGQENDRDYSKVGVWRKARGTEAKYFTAVGYYFAKKLHSELDVPVGIINCTWGGTSASAYVSPEYLTGELQPYLDRAEEAQTKLDPTTELDRYRKLQYSMDNMPFDNSMSNLAPIKPDPAIMASMTEMGELFLSRYSPFRPCGLYETMLKQTAPYTIGGVIWYQGESDAAYADTYELLMQRMIACWRALWHAELPFLIVQLASFEEMMEPLDFVPIRAAQEKLTYSCDQVWLACAMDAGMRYDIHPKHKRPVGERLALQALSKVYGRSILADSPAPEGARREANTIVIRFAHTGEGLTLRGETPETLELIMDGTARSAFSANVCGNELRITSPEIANAKSVTVAFCQHPYCTDNVYNSAGLPVLPFVYTLEE